MKILNQQQFCEKYGLTIGQFFGTHWIEGDLTIDEDQLPIGFNPKVMGSLDLPNLKTIPPWFNPVVRYGLYLPSVVSFEASFAPIVRGCLMFMSVVDLPLGWTPTVFWLNLPSITNLPDWFEPVSHYVEFNRDKNDTYKFYHKWESFKAGWRVFQD